MAVNPKYKRQINAAYRKHGVLPRHLAGLTEVESGWNREAVSPAGARWLTQFMPATAESYGVTGGSTRSQFMGAAKYLKDAGYKRGDKAAIKLALAKYNAGPANPGAAGDYPEKVLASSRKYKGLGRGAGKAGVGGSAPRYRRGGAKTTVTTTPGVDNSELRQQLKLGYLSERGKPDALLELAAGLKGAQDIPGERVVTKTPGERYRRGGGGGKSSAGGGLQIRPDQNMGAKQVAEWATKGIYGSGERTPEQNAAVGGAPGSDHLTTNRRASAVDAKYGTGKQIARKLGIKGWKPGTYDRHTVTIDGRKYSVQILENVAGHYDHTHLGVQRI